MSKVPARIVGVVPVVADDFAIGSPATAARVIPENGLGRGRDKSPFIMISVLISRVPTFDLAQNCSASMYQLACHSPFLRFGK